MDTGSAAGGGDGQRACRRPTRKQIAAAAQETYDRLWYARNASFGRPAAREKATLLIETKYGKADLETSEECQLIFAGRLGALRWLLNGTEIDNYDT